MRSDRLRYPDDFLNKVLQGDCLALMRLMPAKSADLVVTDPPYGLREHGGKKNRYGKASAARGFRLTNYEYGGRGYAIPPKEYFDEIFRVSRNQVIFGGNYLRSTPFNSVIPPVPGSSKRCGALKPRTGSPAQASSPRQSAWRIIPNYVSGSEKVIGSQIRKR